MTPKKNLKKVISKEEIGDDSVTNFANTVDDEKQSSASIKKMIPLRKDYPIYLKNY